MGFLNNLSPQLRLLVLGGAAILFALLVFALGMSFGGSKKPTAANGIDQGYVAVFKHLEPKEQDEAAAALNGRHIMDFKFTDDGTLLVPKGEEADARVALGEAQVPKNPAEPGMSLLDKPNMMSTDWDKKMAFIHALSDEMTEWVRKVDGVDDAAVQINIPDDSLFAQEKKPITASVMVKLLPQASLTTRQVEGIQHMIASAVPGLMVDNVTVVDDNGNLLSSGMEANSGDQSDRTLSRQIEQQDRVRQDMEVELRNRLQQMLDKLVGPGNSDVEVALDLDFSHRTIRQQVYQPVITANGQPLPASRVLNKVTTQGNGQTGGAAGTYANVPSYPILPGAPATQASGGPTTDRLSENEVNAFSKEDQIAQPESGTIRRMSIAILLSDKFANTPLDKLRDVVAAAAGADPARRDQVTVETVHFDDSQLKNQQQQLAAEEAKRKLDKLVHGGIGWKWVWIVGGIVLVLVLLLSLILRRRRLAENPFEALTTSLEPDALPGGFSQSAALGGFPPEPIPGLGPTGGMADPFGGQPYGAPDFGPSQPGFGPPAAPGGEGPFSFLYEAQPDQVAQLLAQERPATAAGVLAQLDNHYAEAVI
ncbi:MAG: flagellar M-ring protein FliF, partial [Cyanobacteria bacterium REEB65]|nr:flagellar M-ring protein FliF [Cyanobacteria bacterium REEB65]